MRTMPDPWRMFRKENRKENMGDNLEEMIETEICSGI